MKNQIRQMEDDSREAAINYEKSLKTVKLELENQFKEAIQQTESIETGLIKEKSEYLRENETQRQLVLRLQEEVGNNQAKLTQLFVENDNLRKQIEEMEQEFNRKYQKELNLRLDIEMELQRQQREQEYVLGQMQAQFMVDQEDLTKSTKNQYKRRISDLTEQHNVHIKSLEGQVKEFEHTVKELKSKLDCSKQIVSKQKVNRSSQTEYAEEMKFTNYINVVEIDALLDALWKERYDTYVSSQLNAAMVCNTEKETPKLSPPVHSGSEENKNTQTKQTQEAQYQELTNEVCRKQKQTEQVLKAQQLTINSERKTLWSLIIEIVSTVIETNNVECLQLAEVLGISWIPISPPASLECLHSIDVNSLIAEHSLAEIRQFSKDLVPQSWMTVLAESVAASSVFSSEVTKLICRQRDQLVRQSRSLKEFQDIIQKQLQIIQEQNVQSQKNILVRQRRQFSKVDPVILHSY
ncbi:hypothetical protein EG68_11229 [Paragonimus skrjabini miyazakii]|uniref:Uncharacterized protein n=1 Tax=Paragonimus skrjabini miyazakii TaxID=59628 RepID=A0A8S9YVK9_9TREM|nr:hypothetical protein EG68_11229 [Paragonimus skrjabini miyazakii]